MKHFFTFQTGGALRTLLILRVPYICKKNDAAREGVRGKG